MATRPRGTYERRGAPAVLQNAPDPAALKAAGAPSTATALRKALGLRDQVREAQRAAQQAKGGIATARKQDLAEQVEAVKRSPRAELSSTRTETAERALQEAEQRLEALVEACEQQADLLLEIGTSEAQQLAEAAQATRTRAVERVAAAGDEVAAAVDELGRALSLANWASAPGKRWKVALGAASVGRRHGGTPIAELVERLRELPGVLEAQRTPPEAEPVPEIHFGWSRAGAPPTPPPPGTVQAS